MTFEIHELKYPLDKYIESIFYYKDFVPEHSIERVVPTGNIFILIELDGFERKIFDKELNPIGYLNKILGFWHATEISKYIQHINIQKCLSIQFKTTGAFPFLKIHINKLNNTVRESDNYFGDSILNLRHKIIQKQNFNDKFEIVEQWLLEILTKIKYLHRK